MCHQTIRWRRKRNQEWTSSQLGFATLIDLERRDRSSWRSLSSVRTFRWVIEGSLCSEYYRRTSLWKSYLVLLSGRVSCISRSYSTKEAESRCAKLEGLFLVFCHVRNCKSVERLQTWRVPTDWHVCIAAQRKALVFLNKNFMPMRYRHTTYDIVVFSSSIEVARRVRNCSKALHTRLIYLKERNCKLSYIGAL